MRSATVRRRRGTAPSKARPGLIEVCRPRAGGRDDGANGGARGRGQGDPGDARRADEPAQGVDGGSSGKPETRPRRVLVVDDEPSIRLLCRVNLAAAGMDVLEAVDGRDALEIVHRASPDLVLLDVMMPGVDGWDVARELAADERTRDLPIVFLTARAERADRERGHELGGVAYLLKPFDPVTLAELVDDVLDRIARGEREQLRRDMFGSP
jgi:CheY-like chemotaxis protein